MSDNRAVALALALVMGPVGAHAQLADVIIPPVQAISEPQAVASDPVSVLPIANEAAKPLVADAVPDPATVDATDEPALPVGAPNAPVKEAAQTTTRIPFDIRPPARPAFIPRTRWQHMDGHALWTRAALSALKEHGKPLVDIVPRDIAQWCPAYPTNSDAQRRAFWVGYMSALAKHESTYKPWAVGGGGRWYGLLQILPATARGYKCNVGTGEALKNGAANLSCAVRIMAFTVNRDGVIHGRDAKWRGVSADWGPMRKAAKRRDMAGWLRQQNYCEHINTLRPRTRP